MLTVKLEIKLRELQVVHLKQPHSFVFGNTAKLNLNQKKKQNGTEMPTGGPNSCSFRKNRFVIFLHKRWNNTCKENVTILNGIYSLFTAPLTPKLTRNITYY